jgi:SAM-dependent methyltransferase
MTPEEAFFTLHRDLPREGPGLAEDVIWALGHAWSRRHVIDAACGPGADTVTLAEALPDAQITGIDRQAHFVAAAQARVTGLGPRVTVAQGDLRDLTGPVDFIWCAGAVYIVGIEAALAAWRSVLAPGGRVAFSEPVLLTDPPDPVAGDFWSDEGQTVGAEAAILARIEGAGWRVIATRIVCGAAWSDYYGPMQARIDALQSDAHDPALIAVLQDGQREIDLWRAAPDSIAYLLVVAEPA